MQDEFDYGQSHADEKIGKLAAFNRDDCAEAEPSNYFNSQSAAASIATQNDAIARAAASCGIHLQRVFGDIGPTGSSQSELEHLVKAAESGGVSAIVVASTTRLSRSLSELRKLEERFSAAGIAIINAEG